eukprot:TRINITY_DN200_c0_g1_i1.p1 TRINITY_DN200_c0_g1~~TRINITY_DN200_c0_g1_i1.p1  ORF type:complete len:373 (+),score=117.27 TRINITY_DN200_c0_g1_i1:86-1204(+)
MPNCAGCNAELGGNHLEALDKFWHPSCFKCSHCEKALGGDSFTVYNDKPYHEACYEIIREHIVCHGCEGEVEPGKQYITAMEHTWHHPCFTCVFCVKPFDDNLFFKYAPAAHLNEQPCHRPCKPELDAGKKPGRFPKSWQEYYDKLAAEEEERKRKAEEEERRKREAEEAERKRKEEEEEAERKRKEEEERKKREAEEAAEAERKRKEEEAEAERKRKEEEERLKREAEEAERKRKEDEERRRLEEEERKKREAEARDAALPKCTACQQPIRESSHRIYGDKSYHFACFQCAGCSKPLESDGPFPFKNEKLWHDECCPRNNCGKCNLRIDATELSALGKHWHPDCFVCAKCSGKLTTAFKLKDGTPYHTECM